MNLTIELTTQQVIDLVQQMPPEEKFLVVRALTKETPTEREGRMNMPNQRLENYVPNADWIGTL